MINGLKGAENMGKNNGLLWAIGGAAAIYFLMPKAAQAAGALVPDITFPEIKFPEIKMPEIGFPEIKLPDIEVNIPSIPEMLGMVPVPPTSEGPAPVDVGAEGAAVSEWNLEDIRQRAGTIAGVGTGLVTAVGTSRVIPIATRGLGATLTRVAPRVAGTGAAKLGLKFIPVVGWVYLAADVGATVYELISGKSIGGDWLGWGEMIREIF